MYIRSFTKIVDDAIDIVRSEKKEMMLSNFLMGIIFMGAIMVLGIILSIMGAFLALGEVDSVNIMGIIGIILLAIFILTLVAVMQGSIMILTDGYYQGQSKVGATYAVGRSLKRIFALMGYSCLEILGCIPFVIIGGIAIYIVSGIMNITPDNFNAITSLSGFTFLSIASIFILAVVVIFLIAIYSAFFSFGIAAIVIDDLGPIDAFKKSLNLIKGEFIEIVKKFFLIQLGIYGINICFSMLLGLIGALLGVISVFSGSFNTMWMQPIASLIEWPTRIVFNLLFTAFNPAIIAVFYYNQKCKKEGIDMYKQFIALQRRTQSENDHTSNPYKSFLDEKEKVNEQGI